MKRLFLITIILAGLQHCQAQRVLYSNYVYSSPFIYNPVYAGLNINQVAFGANTQWLGVKNSPVMYSMDFQGRLGTFNFYNPKMMLNKTKFRSDGKTGIGLSVFNEQQDEYDILASNFAYGYHLSFANQQVSFGLLINYSRTRLNCTNFTVVSTDDPLLQESFIKDDYFNSSFGMAYSNKKITAGISLSQFIPNYLSNDLGLDFYYPSGAAVNIDLVYQMKKSDNFEFIPQFFLSVIKNSKLCIIGFESIIKNNTHVFVNYQSLKIFGFSLQHDFQRFYCRYNLNLSTSRKVISNSGSHGITIGHTFKAITN